MTEKEKTEQLNFYATPTSTVERFDEFEHNYRKVYKPEKSLSRSAIGAMVLDAGLDVCEKELEKKSKQK